jgi:hypothetical protein
LSGLGQRKAEILAAGAQDYMLASAMMETDDMMADYTLGDGKTGDPFNAGICKQNWYMIRTCHPEWQNLTADDYMTATAMNSDLALDVQVYDKSRAHFGDLWWAGHRNGWTGVNVDRTLRTSRTSRPPWTGPTTSWSKVSTFATTSASGRT